MNFVGWCNKSLHPMAVAQHWLQGITMIEKLDNVELERAVRRPHSHHLFVDPVSACLKTAFCLNGCVVREIPADGSWYGSWHIKAPQDWDEVMRQIQQFKPRPRMC